MRLISCISFLGLCLIATSALADGPTLKTEQWTTSEGDLTLSLLPFSFQAVYTQDNGRMIGALGDGVWTGFWGEDSSNTECKTTMLGTKFWGRISLTFNKARSHFDGKWSYCDGALDGDWTGDRK